MTTALGALVPRRGLLDPHDIKIEGPELDPDAPATGLPLVEPARFGPEEIDLSVLARGSAERPVVGLVNRLLVEAYRRGASDIHVEPGEKDVAVRLRVDGLLTDLGRLPLRLRESVAT